MLQIRGVVAESLLLLMLFPIWLLVLSVVFIIAAAFAAVNYLFKLGKIMFQKALALCKSGLSVGKSL